MKKVRYTKEPTILQMSRMASNLNENFGIPSLISVEAWDDSMSNTNDYRLYVESTYNINFSTWQALQIEYFELIEVV